MPGVSYEELLSPMNETVLEEEETPEEEEEEAEQHPHATTIHYDGKNMAAIVVLLEFLNDRLDKVRNGLDK